MIIVSRLNGETFGLNADLIERVEAMPDTVITLVDGKKLLVREGVEDVIERVVEYRASILTLSYRTGEPDAAAPADGAGHRPAPLRLVGEAPVHDRSERG